MPLLLIFLLSNGAVLAQEGGNRAGLVVVHGDGRVVTRCVAFEEAQISGLALLQRSGLALADAAGPMGSIVCSLNGEGCPATDCWCQCKGTPCSYWIYFHGNPDGSWAYANIGAAMRQLGNGDVDGWLWGDTSSVPPAMSFAAICGAASDASAPTPAPPEPTVEVAATATPYPEATATQRSSPTPSPTSSVTPLTEVTSLPPTLTSTATETATPSPTAIPSPDAAATDALAPSLTPSPSGQDTSQTDTQTVTSGDTALSGYVSFLAILGVIGGAFFLMRRRRRV